MNRSRKEPTVAAVIDAYLAEQELRWRAGALAGESLIRARHYLGSFKAKHGAKLCQKPDCSKTDITSWLLDNPGWESSHTKQDAVGQVITCFRWAEDDLIDHSPYRRPRGLWSPPQPRQAMTPEEYRAVMNTARSCRKHPTGQRRSRSKREQRRRSWQRTIRQHLGQHQGPLFLFRCSADQWRGVVMAYNARRSVDYIRVEESPDVLLVVATVAPPTSIYAREVDQAVAIKRLLATLPSKAKGGRQRQFSSSFGWKLLPADHAGKGSGGAPRPRGRDRAHPGRTAFRIMLWALWETGSRTCELRNAKFEHVDWDTHIIRLTDHKTKKATGLDRIIALNRRAFRLVRWLYRHRRPGQEYIFLNSRGRQWDKLTYSKQFKRFARMAGIRHSISPYSARHGYCVRALEFGMGERQIADLLGQSSTKYVSHYGKSTRNKVSYLRNLADKL